MEQDELRVCQVQWLAKSNAAITLSAQDGFGTLLNMKETQMFAGRKKLLLKPLLEPTLTSIEFLDPNSVMMSLPKHF